jgi:hypothetical protein
MISYPIRDASFCSGQLRHRGARMMEMQMPPDRSTPALGSQLPEGKDFERMTLTIKQDENHGALENSTDAATDCSKYVYHD